MKPRVIPITPAEVVRHLAWDARQRASAFAVRADTYTDEEAGALLRVLDRAGVLAASEGVVLVSFGKPLATAMQTVAALPKPLPSPEVLAAEAASATRTRRYARWMR